MGYIENVEREHHPEWDKNSLHNLIDVMNLNICDEIIIQNCVKETLGDLKWSKGDRKDKRELELTTLIVNGEILTENKYLVTQKGKNSLQYSLNGSFSGTKSDWKGTDKGATFDLYDGLYKEGIFKALK